MKIIALQGKSSCGKTTTLKLMIQKIIEKGIFICEPPYLKDELLKMCEIKKGDIQCVFSYKGIKIGITTRGDTKDLLGNDFSNHFSECSIVLCAIHTYGQTVDFVISKGEVIVHSKWFVTPKSAKKEYAVNSIQADFLINEVIDSVREMKL